MRSCVPSARYDSHRPPITWVFVGPMIYSFILQASILLLAELYIGTQAGTRHAETAAFKELILWLGRQMIKTRDE